jgi:alpha-ribazole phosphatase
VDKKNMITLYLVRHGETEWNAEQRFQGHSDVPLNENGRRQAEAIAQHLATQELDAIYASDLSRAWDTAAAIAAHHDIELAAEANLREGSFGQWEGLTYAEIEQRDPKAVAAWHEDISSFSPPAGESIHQLHDRVAAAYRQIAARHADQTVLLVAHGGSLQMLICLLLGLPAKSFWQFNLGHCSLSKISIYEAGAIINTINDTNHILETL